MNNYEDAYRKLLLEIVYSGARKDGRNGGTRSRFGLTLTVDLKAGFPLLTGRQMFYKGVFGEMAAFIRGCELLVDYKDFGCNYWDINANGWAEPGTKYEDLTIGQYVGSLWRDFSAYTETQSDDHEPRDQLRVLIDQLKYNPASRRHVLSAWHPGAESCLPPCTVMAIFNVEGRDLHCHVTQRSADMCLGLPSDVAGYALLVELLAKEVGLRAGKLMFTLVDAHIYNEHFTGVSQYLEEPTYSLPQLTLKNQQIFLFKPDDAELEPYLHGPIIRFPFVA